MLLSKASWGKEVMSLSRASWDEEVMSLNRTSWGEEVMLLSKVIVGEGSDVTKQRRMNNNITKDLHWREVTLPQLYYRSNKHGCHPLARSRLI